MLGVQGVQIILEDREVEHGRSGFLQVAVTLCDDLGAPEAILRVRRVASRNKDRRVVNFDVHCLFDWLRERDETARLPVPQRSWGRQ